MNKLNGLDGKIYIFAGYHLVIQIQVEFCCLAWHLPSSAGSLF